MKTKAIGLIAVTALFSMVGLVLIAATISHHIAINADASSQILVEAGKWAEITEPPVKVASHDGPNGYDNLGMMKLQCRIGMADPVTAFVNVERCVKMSNPLPSRGGNWKVGDEVRVVTVDIKVPGNPGNTGRSVPSTVYFVIDYRSVVK